MGLLGRDEGARRCEPAGAVRVEPDVLGGRALGGEFGDGRAVGLGGGRQQGEQRGEDVPVGGAAVAQRVVDQFQSASVEAQRASPARGPASAAYSRTTGRWSGSSPPSVSQPVAR